MNARTFMFRGVVALISVFSTALAAVSPAAAATLSARIDFEGLPVGSVVSSVSHASGISGEDGGGYVGIFGVHPPRAANAAMIFDATCGGSFLTCSGGDDDLFNPPLGNIMIISEDLDSSNPDDADIQGTYFHFDFSTWADGVVTVDSITVQDIEAEENEGGAQVDLYGSSVLLTTIALPVTGDGGSAVVPIGVSGVDEMIVELNGSGAIDNIGISWEEEDHAGGEGCTPGYWKQDQHFDSWVGYSPADSFDMVFGVTSSFNGTLLGGLKLKGGGESAMARHAVAALLDSANSDVNYMYTTSEVISMVQAAYLSGAFETTKDLFAVQNELGCVLN